MSDIELSSWHSYPSVFALGHRNVEELFLDPVLVEEKIDGSQFSFGSIEVEGQIELRIRSKGATMIPDAPEKMFAAAALTARSLLPILHPGWTYRCEYLAKPKHNTLIYDRIPLLHLIVFDVNTGHESYLSYDEKKAEAERLGLECVPQLYAGKVESIEFFRSLLDMPSVLGGTKVEGVVVKNYQRFGKDKKVLMGKFVSEAFKEIHAADWKDRNPKQGDIILRMIDRYRTPARWAKAVQHLRERGELEQSPRDIGKLIGECRADIERECAEEISKLLLEWALPNILRGCQSGLPEWYKEELLKLQFQPTDSQRA